MTAKETLVEALRSEGWGFIEACENVERVIEEFMVSSEQKTILHTATRTFVLRKKVQPSKPGCQGCGSACGVPECGICTGQTLCTKCQRRQECKCP